MTTQINNFISLVPNLERQVPQLEELSAVDVRGAGEGIVDDGTRRGTGADNGGHDVCAAVMGQAGLRELPATQMQGPVPSHVYVRGVL